MSAGNKMQAQLFYGDPAGYFRMDYLRSCARDEVERSPLIVLAAAGDRRAAAALHIGFWPFVQEFEIAIDKRQLPRQPLTRKFGAAAVRSVFGDLVRAVAQMKEEEGSHAGHWLKDANELGLRSLESDCRAHGVQALVDAAYTDDLTQFFAALAGTEFIAEELSRFLTGSLDYVGLFRRKRWVWGDVHLMPHDDGPSHLEIDMDLARAYCPDEQAYRELIEQQVIDTIRLFGAAALDVETMFGPSLLRA